MRDAHVMAAKQIENFKNKQSALASLQGLVQEGRDLLLSNRGLDSLGEMLNSAWVHKRGLCDGITNSQIEAVYSMGLMKGATGGKLLGAGGGGFMLFYVPESERQRFIKWMNPISFKIDRRGAQVIINE
jgi:D-glycero-alpha-D-manno-heptose-7-phosphate kinase